jgi:aspartate aminotransferase
MSRIGTESAFDVLVRARALEAQGADIIHLEIGEPDFPTPAHIVDAAKKALDEGWTHYGPTQGLPELREAIAEYVSRRAASAVRPERVRDAGRQADHLFSDDGAAGAGRRGDLSLIPDFPFTNR